MVLDWIPDPKQWFGHDQAHYTVNPLGDPVQRALVSKINLAHNHPSLRQYPLVTQQGDVPVHLVGSPQPASTYQPVPVTPTDGVMYHHGETLRYTAQGEEREWMDHPLQHVGYTLRHHPWRLAEVLWNYARRTLGWVVWNYQDFYQQLQAWDGTVPGLIRHMGLWWRGAVVTLITLGFLEMGPVLNALATWTRLVFDLVRGVGGLAVSVLDEVWYLLEKIVADITGLWSS